MLLNQLICSWVASTAFCSVLYSLDVYHQWLLMMILNLFFLYFFLSSYTGSDNKLSVTSLHHNTLPPALLHSVVVGGMKDGLNRPRGRSHEGMNSYARSVSNFFMHMTPKEREKEVVVGGGNRERQSTLSNGSMAGTNINFFDKHVAGTTIPRGERTSTIPHR
jgi:hypothetical protein